MKDFDVGRAARRRPEEDRTFVLAGETFVLKNGVRPEAMSGFDEIKEDSPIGETMAVIDGMFLELVEDRDDTAGRYAAIRSQDDDPVTVDDLREVVEWMIEEATGRPTGSPSGSKDGQTSIETSSTVDSSSRASRAATKV